MNLPLVTVVCNCYNHAPYVIQSIQSVEQQTYKNIELIVLNNGSTDNSYEIIQRYLTNTSGIKWVHWEKSLPITQAFNRIVEIAKGDFLIDLAADDMLLPHCIEMQVNQFMKEEESVGIVFGNVYLVDEKGENKTSFFEVDSQGKAVDKSLHQVDYLRLLNSGKGICSVSAMMRRSTFEELGGYDENLFFEDLDYWFRLARKYKIKFIDEFLVCKRQLPRSLGTQMEKNDELTKKIHASIIKIYKQAIDYNDANENRMLLRRIHYSIHNCFTYRLWEEMFSYVFLAFCCRWTMLIQKKR